MDPQKMRQVHESGRPGPLPRRYDGVNGNPLYDPANGGHYGMCALCMLMRRQHAFRSVASHPLEETPANCVDQVPLHLYVLFREGAKV